jgi:hypothetical protein
MSEQTLRDLLRQLHAELEEGPSVDEPTGRLLRDVAADIDSALQRAREETRAEHHGMVERLRDATWNLEESHPKLTTTVSQIVETLTTLFR